jgi:hypothetical protein
MFAYQVYGMNTADTLPDPKFASNRRDPSTTARDWVNFLALPALAPADLSALTSFVNEIGRGPDAATFVRNATVWLQRRHAYSLQSSLPAGGGDPLVRWLSSGGPGHCELFAGSLVVLARVAGYPARLITGFRGGAWNAYSGSYSVRNANAHAWCEVFDDAAAAWRRADPTPGSDAFRTGNATDPLALNGARPPETGWQARLESLRVFWYRRIVNFDQTTQVEIIDATKDAFKTTSARIIKAIDARLNAIRVWVNQPWGGGRWLTFLISTLALGALVWLWRTSGKSRWLRWRSTHARTSDHDPVRAQAGRWLRKIARLPTNQNFPASLRHDLQALRYGPRSTWPDPATTLRHAKTAFRTARQTRPPAGRS